MHALMLGLTVSAAAILPAPAGAVDTGQMAFVGTPAVTIHSGFGFGGNRDGHRRRHRDDGAVFIYDRDYQGDTVWRPDGFNDWWHDRPERAYPHWMLSNQNCEKQWWAGDSLRC